MVGVELQKCSNRRCFSLFLYFFSFLPDRFVTITSVFFFFHAVLAFGINLESTQLRNCEILPANIISIQTCTSSPACSFSPTVCLCLLVSKQLLIFYYSALLLICIQGALCLDNQFHKRSN